MTATADSRIVTVPNLISFTRILGVPFFFTAITSRHFLLALGLLVYAGFSDWADGQIARRFNQYSRLGENLDPVADRLYIASTVIGLALVDVVPWWLVAALIARDLCMAVFLVLLKRRGILGVPVHYVGKAATMLLLYSFPFLMLGEAFSTLHDIARAIGWAFGLWGLGMYWYAATLYWRHAQDVEPSNA